jgi:hypothetical protein
MSKNGQDDRLEMYLTFSERTLTVDNSPAGGGTFNAPYKFKDERTIVTSLFPDNLIIERLSGNTMKIRPEMGGSRKTILMIYVCKFVKTVK